MKAYRVREHLQATDGQPLCLTKGKAIFFVRAGTAPTCQRCLVLSAYRYKTLQVPGLAQTHTASVLNGVVVRALCGDIDKTQLQAALVCSAPPQCPLCAERLQQQVQRWPAFGKEYLQHA